MSHLWQDLRFAARTLTGRPGFLLTAVLSLALGIGANTAIFSLINAVMLRMIPVTHPDQLVLLTDPGSSGIAPDTTEHGVRNLLSYPEFEQIRAHQTVFAGMFAAESQLSDIDMLTPSSAEPVKVRAQLVSGEFFSVLGVGAAMGRTFTSAEDQAPGANPVAVISYDFWQRQFGGKTAVLGETIRLSQSPFRIIGVTPAGFNGMLVGVSTDVWVPITMQAQVLPGHEYLKPRDTLWLQVMARLKDGMSRQTAQAGINVTFQQVEREIAQSEASAEERSRLLDNKLVVRDGARGASDLRDQFSDSLLILMAMVGLVLLIACANIANLTLARASGRQREIGVRLALGAGRRRLLQQFLTESVLVAALGGTVGAFFAMWGTDLLIGMVSGSVNDLSLSVHRDFRVFAFTAVVSLLTGVLCGLSPALRAARVDVNRTLSAQARGAIGGRGSVKSGRVLVVAQVSLSLLLLIGATLFVRTLHNLMTQKLGFDREHLLLVHLDPVPGGYKGSGVSAFYQRATDEFGRIPRVAAVSLSNTGVFAGDSGDHLFVEGSKRTPEESRSSWTLVGPDFFRTTGIPLLRGREIVHSEAAQSASVCVINAAFAQYFYGDADPIGRHITDLYPTTRVTCEIVGVAANSREHRLTGAPERRFYANIYHPIGAVGTVTFLLRATAGSNVAAAVRSTLAQINRAVPILSIRTVEEQLDRRLVTQRLIAELSAFFGALALLLSAIGLYGVMAYSTARRTSEIGIRMALGASTRSVLWMVLRETVWLVALGVGIGLPCAIGAARLVSNRLFGLTPADPATIGMAIGIITATAVLAGYLPARRAAAIDPMRALRCD